MGAISLKNWKWRSRCKHCQKDIKPNFGTGMGIWVHTETEHEYCVKDKRLSRLSRTAEPMTGYVHVYDEELA